MKEIFVDPDGLIENVRSTLSHENVEYDTFVGSGLSAALILPRLATALDCAWAVVRKKSEGSHSCNEIEGTIGERWVFFDDLIETGETWHRVQKAVYDNLRHQRLRASYVGAVTYSWEVTYWSVGREPVDPEFKFEYDE